ncbi:MAG: hypothetical protein U9Q67_01225 [Patescibacteria group bacterium]|nr:hypothetical protein [Patescibacteria group bacterium]
MTNFRILESYQELLQYAVLLDRILKVGTASVGYYKADNSPYWNFALVNKVIMLKELQRVEAEYKVLDRKTTFYFEDRKELSGLKEFLKENGYRRLYEDSWMFWTKGNIDSRQFESIKEVKTDKDLDVFTRTYDKCYQEDDSQNPYGGFEEPFLRLLKKAWLRYSTKHLDYFIAYKHGDPVAVSILVNYKGLGYITAVGSIKDVRGEGYGKAVTMYCLQKSNKNGNKIHFLGTEEGKYPNEFYRRIGFATKFKALYYRKV